MNDNTKICTSDAMNLEETTHLYIWRPRKFRSDAFLFWSRGPDSYRKNDRKRAVVWPWLVLELSTVFALTQLGIRQSDWWRAGIRSTNLHIVVECHIINWEYLACMCSAIVHAMMTCLVIYYTCTTLFDKIFNRFSAINEEWIKLSYFVKWQFERDQTIASLHL